MHRWMETSGGRLGGCITFFKKVSGWSVGGSDVPCRRSVVEDFVDGERRGRCGELQRHQTCAVTKIEIGDTQEEKNGKDQLR